MRETRIVGGRAVGPSPRDVACEKCGASRGESCLGRVDIMRGYHVERRRRWYARPGIANFLKRQPC